MNPRRIISAFILAMSCLAAQARAPFVRFGIEWGYGPEAYAKVQQSYLTSVGYRIDSGQEGMEFFNCGFVMANVGINAMEHLSVSIHSGYMGISRDNRVIPVLLRVTGHINGCMEDGIFVFLDGGVGFHILKEDQPNRNPGAMGDAGVGYGLRMSSGMALDFAFSIRGFYDRPLIQDPDTHKYITGDDVIKNDAFFINPCISVGFRF